MDSIEFLNFAKKINSDPNKSEIDCRQVVSRSYYCAFHKVREKANTVLGIPVNAYKGGTHASLTTTLATLRPANNKLKGIAFRLKAFHLLRIKADYKLSDDDVVTEISSQEAIMHCEKILHELSQVNSR